MNYKLLFNYFNLLVPIMLQNYDMVQSCVLLNKSHNSLNSANYFSIMPGPETLQLHFGDRASSPCAYKS